MADGSERARLRALAAEVERSFPLTCRRTLLILADLDPDQLQAQWQVEPGLLALVKGGFPADLAGVGPRLRLLRVDAGDQEVATLSLSNGRGDGGGVARFLVSGGPGVRYRAELGIASPEGGWLLLTRSNVASLPPHWRQVEAEHRATKGGGEAKGAGDESAAVPRQGEVVAVLQGMMAGREVGKVEAEGGTTAEAGLTLATMFMIGQSPSRSEALTFPPDPTLADAGVPLAPVFPLPILPEAVAGHLAPGQAAWAAAKGRFRLLPAQGITPLVIAREPPPPGQGNGAASGEGLAGEGSGTETRPGTPGGSRAWREWLTRSGSERLASAWSLTGTLAHLSFPGTLWPHSPGSPTSPAWPARPTAVTDLTSRVPGMPTPVAPDRTGID